MKEIRRIEFSIEPIVYTGLTRPPPALPPSFNVTLRAGSNHYVKAKLLLLRDRIYRQQVAS